MKAWMTVVISKLKTVIEEMEDRAIDRAKLTACGASFVYLIVAIEAPVIGNV